MHCLVRTLAARHVYLHCCEMLKPARWVVTVVALALALPALASRLAAQALPMTGDAVPALAGFDSIVSNLMIKWGIPGGAVAVTSNGRLVYARGFGWADRDRGEAVQPTSLFRIASLSKSLTSAAILLLVQQGTLQLDDHVFCATGTCPLASLQPAGRLPDPRLYDITIRNLLQHAGGFDRDRSFDPMFMPTTERAALEAHQQPPATCEAVIRYMLKRPLDFGPGTRYAYSNFGYCILGRVVEKVGGLPYETFVQTNVLGPAGVHDMRIGRSLIGGRATSEVRYYDIPGSPLEHSVFPGAGDVPRPYGAFNLEAMDSHGGWIASAVDLVRYVASLDGRRPPALLQPRTLKDMLGRPDLLSASGNEPAYYGMGWQVRPTSNGEANWWHTGSLPGTMTIMVREGQTPFHLGWAALFNLRPQDADAFIGEVDRALWRAVRQVNRWPTTDLFGRYQ